MIEDFSITNIDGYEIKIKADTTLAQYFDFGDKEIKKIFQYKNYYSDVLFNDKSPVETTMIYTHVAKKDLLKIQSPLDTALIALSETDKRAQNKSLSDNISR